jgi:Fasciclin domain
MSTLFVAQQIFAPNNEAFEALHPATMELLQSTGGRGVLIETMQRHFLPLVLPTTNDVVPIGTNTTLGSAGLLLQKDASGVMSINGATFTARDTLAFNGIVHTIGAALLPNSAVATPAPAQAPASASAPTEASCGSYTCPQYMEPKQANQDCQESIADCQCISGYEIQQDDGSCLQSTSVADDADAAAVERLCNFQCPSNARRRENRQCWSNMDDCYCVSGYQKSGNACVQARVEEFVNRCMYTCPPNSSKRPNRNCIESFDDCQCNPGRIAISIGCV